jgi:predicted nucleotidyltransferase
MDGMSFEEAVLLQVMRAVNLVGFEAIVIGNAAAALHGVPITTQDIDLFARDTPRNREKIDQLIKSLGSQVVSTRPFEPVSNMIRIEGLPVDIDILFGLSSHAKFESVRSRSSTIVIEGVPILVSDLQDVIDAKRAAARPRDQAVLPLLEQHLRVRKEMENQS